MLVLSMPLWLPVLGILLAFGILFAPEPIQAEPAVPDDDDDALPADHVPPPPSWSATPWRLRPVEPKAPALAEPAPALIADALPASRPSAEQLRAETSCWTRSFPAG